MRSIPHGNSDEYRGNEEREGHDICCGPYPPPAVWWMHGGARGSMMSLFLASLLPLLLSSPRNQETQQKAQRDLRAISTCARIANDAAAASSSSCIPESCLGVGCS